MKKLIFIFFLANSIISCNSDDENQNYSQCLQEGIDLVLQNSVQSPKANIERYMYEGEEVYLINFQNFPDGQSVAVTIDCVSICSLGGIDGPNNDCPNWGMATFIETVWEDPR